MQVDRTGKILQAAARDAAARARLLAEALDSLAEAAEGLVEIQQRTADDNHQQIALSGNDQLWTVADVAKFLGASLSWVRHASASGQLPRTRIGGLLRFHPDEVRAYARGESNAYPGAVVLPRTRRPPSRRRDGPSAMG